MAAIDNAIKHFKSQYERRSFKVPEWGESGKPLEIFVDPLTLKQKQEVEKIMNTKGDGEGLAYIIHLKALDENGKKIFNGEHLRLMNQADPNIVAETAAKIWKLGQGIPVYDDDELKCLSEEEKEALQKADTLEDIKKN